MTLFPGVRLSGKEAPETEKPAPDIVAELIVNALVPLDVTVSDWVPEDPTPTIPKSSDVELRAKSGFTA